jgi:hypothetical protein
MPLSAQTVKLDSTRIDSVPVTVWSKSTTKWYTKTVVQLDTVHIPIPSVLNPVRVGPWFSAGFPPSDSVLAVYSASLMTGVTNYTVLPKAKANKAVAVLYHPRNKMRSGDTISVAVAKEYINSLPDFSSYQRDGTLWGIIVADDITGNDIWGPLAQTTGYLAKFDSIAMYWEQKIPGVRTVIRSAPEVIARFPAYKLKYADWAWSQYSARYGSVIEYRDRNIAIAKTLGLCNAFGINTVNGGDGSSGIGVMPKAEMSAAEVVKYAKALLPYTPIFLDWEYRADKEVRLAPARKIVRQMADTMVAPSGCP